MLCNVEGIDLFGFDGLKYYCVIVGEFCGYVVLVVCIGYIGEDGFEFYLVFDVVFVLWDVLFEIGGGLGVVFVGFVVCDILCFEVGMLLYGYEFGIDIFLE